MAKLLDKSARRGGCRWLPCRLTSGLDSADPDETTVRSVVTLVISKMESGPASVDVASSCPLWPPVRDQAAGESSVVENTNITGATAISSQASSRAALLMRRRRGGPRQTDAAAQ